MSNWKKLVMIFLVLTLATYGVQAIQVNPVYNTDKCWKNCYTIYNITLDKEDYDFNETNFWFEFKDLAQEELRHAKNVSSLTDFTIQWGSPVYKQRTEWISTPNCKILDENGSCKEEGYYANITYFDYDWLDFNNTGAIQKNKGDYFLLKVSGKKYKWDEAVDNVLVMYDPTNPNATNSYVKYEQYYWWGSFTLNTGLVAYYSMDNASTASITDLIAGVNLNSSTVGSVKTAKLGSGTNYTTAVEDDYATGYDAFDIADGMLVAWIKPFALSATARTAADLGDQGGEGTMFATSGLNLACRTRIGGVDRTTNYNNNLLINNFYFVACAWNTTTASDKIAVYLGNATNWVGHVNNVSGGFGAITDTGSVFRLGERSADTGGEYEGIIDEVALYNIDWTEGTAAKDDFLEALWNASNGCNPVLYNECNATAPIPFKVNNETWETTGLFDSGGVSNYSINVSIDRNTYNNISDINFSINGFVYSDAQIQNSTNFPTENWTRFNISVYTPLVSTNNSNINFNWTWIAQGNGSNSEYGNSSNRTQPVNWGWYINNQTYQSPVFSGRPNRIVVNFTKHVVSGVGLNYNVSNEWNQTNRTATELLTNVTGYEEWNLTFVTPAVYVQTFVQMKGWLNISFNGSMVNRDPNFTQEILPISVNATVVYDNPVFETGRTNFTMNVTWNGNDVNFVLANFTYNGTPTSVYTTSISNQTGYLSGNINWTYFNITIRPNLTASNASNYTFQWNLTINTNATNFTSATSITNQTILFAYYINNVTWTSTLFETISNSFLLNMTKHVDDAQPSMFRNTTIEYNAINRSLGVLVTNTTTFEEYNLTMTSPTVGANTVFNFKSWLNLSFQTVFRTRNDSNQTQLVLNDGVVSNETYTTPIFETSLANFTINITNATVNITNINFTWNHTQHNGSNITNVSTGNNTVFNVTLRVPLVSLNNTNMTFRWNYTTNVPENLSSNATNQSVRWAHYPNRLHILAGVTEGDSQTATVNVTKHIFIGTTTRTVNLEYNQTNISTTLVANVSPFIWSDYNATFTTPLVLADTTVQARGWLNVSFGGENYLRNTSNSSQLIVNINVTAGTNCTNVTGFVAVLNFTFHDEFTNATIAENGSSQITIWNITQTSNQTFGFEFVNTTFHTICLQPPVNFTGDYFLQYENFTNSTANYPIREFWKRNQSIDNVTDQYHLYSILLSNSTEIVFNVQDSNADPAPNVIVEALKYNISNNSFMIVDSGITDFDGKTRLRLFKADDYYKIVARDGGGRIVLETSLFKILFNEYFLRLEPFGLTTIGTVIQLKNIPHNLTFDNGTMRAVLTWNDVMNVSGQSCLEITNMTANNTGIIVNKQCSTNISGSLQFDFTGFNGTYVAKYVTGTNSFLIDAIDVLLGGFTNLGRSGLFLAFMLIGTFTAVGVVINPTLGLVFFLVGFIGTWLVGLLQISWLPFTSVVAIVIITAFILKKDIL